MGRAYLIRAVQPAVYVDKEFANLQAQAYLTPATSLVRIDDDRGNELFVLTRSSVTRHFRTLADVRCCLDLWRGERE